MEVHNNSEQRHWYGRYRRMLQFMGHTYKDVAAIIGQSESSANNFSNALPRQMKYAVTVWEAMNPPRKPLSDLQKSFDDCKALYEFITNDKFSCIEEISENVFFLYGGDLTNDFPKGDLRITIWCSGLIALKFKEKEEFIHNLFEIVDFIQSIGYQPERNLIQEKLIAEGLKQVKISNIPESCDSWHVQIYDSNINSEFEYLLYFKKTRCFKEDEYVFEWLFDRIDTVPSSIMTSRT